MEREEAIKLADEIRNKVSELNSLLLNASSADIVVALELNNQHAAMFGLETRQLLRVEVIGIAQKI